MNFLYVFVQIRFWSEKAATFRTRVLLLCFRLHFVFADCHVTREGPIGALFLRSLEVTGVREVSVRIRTLNRVRMRTFLAFYGKKKREKFSESYLSQKLFNVHSNKWYWLRPEFITDVTEPYTAILHPLKPLTIGPLYKPVGCYQSNVHVFIMDLSHYWMHP